MGRDAGALMRILQVHAPYREPGGEDRVVAAEAHLLSAAGHDVAQHLQPNPTGPVVTAAAIARSSWNAAAGRAVRDAVRAHRPDVVHVHNTWFALSPAVLAAAADEGVAVVATLHNHRLVCPAGTLFRDGAPCDLCVGRLPVPGIRHRCYRSSALSSAAAAVTVARPRARRAREGVDAWIAPTSGVRDSAVVAGIDPARIHVHWHFCDAAPPRAQVPSASRRVVAAGRLVPEKGFDVLLAAWDASELAHRGWTLDIYGDGPERDELQRGAGTGVRLHGWVDGATVGEALREARVAVVPSRWAEPFGLTAAESLAAGTGVLTSDVGDLASIVGDAGLAVAPGDADALGTALALATSDEVVDAWGDAARRRHEAHLAPAAGLDRLERVYAIALEATTDQRSPKRTSSAPRGRRS